jgi:cytochrome c-type biogenesis protein CcmF
MLPEIGNFFLLLAIIASIPAIFSRKNIYGYLLSSLVLSAYIVLIYSFVTSDFSVVNVYLNSSTIKPLIYKISAAWASHEGSIMLFVLTLSMVDIYLRRHDWDISQKSFHPITAIISGFLLIIYFTSTPFGRLLNPPVEGLGLNPSLQDPALAIHPPILYLGYALYSAPYSITVSALWNRINIVEILTRLKFYSGLALAFLTIGVGLGSWWAYRELGWGGYWFFDPVENTSLVVWIMGIAFHHMIILARRENKYSNLMALTAILTFLLSLMGTFLVRSGILLSIHSFAFDATRGAAIFALFSIISLMSLGLIAIRAKESKDQKIPALKNNIFFVSLAFLLIADLLLIIATLYPPFMQLYSGTEFTIDITFYLKSFVPLCLLAVLLAPLVLYKEHAILSILGAFIALCIAYYYAKDIVSAIGVLAGLNLIFWAIIHSRIKKIPTIMGHFGLGLFVLAISLNCIFKETKEFIGKLDHKIEFKNYDIELFDIKYAKSENYMRQIAKFKITDRDENKIFFLNPEQRLYMIEKMTKSKPHINTTVTSDLYFVLLNIKDDEVHAEFHYNPAIFLLWFSVFLMALSLLWNRLLRGLSS